MKREVTVSTDLIGTERLADRLVDLARDSARSASRHHTVLVGPAGRGKSALLARVERRVCADAEIAARLLVARLPADPWTIGCFGDLLLAILDALQERYPEHVAAATVADLYRLSPHDRARRAEDLLEVVARARPLLLLTEELETIFAALGETGQQRLRSYLQERPIASILATTPTLFAAISRQTAPFYGFFAVTHLPAFTLEETALLLEQLARRQGDSRLMYELHGAEGRARVAALHHLAGGSPGFYATYAEHAAAGTGTLRRTLTAYAARYRPAIAARSLQQRQIIVWLCRRGQPRTVSDLAAHIGTTNQSIAAQLGRLRDERIVTAIPIGRETYYELADPLMRLALTARQSGSAQPEALLAVLQNWFFCPAPTDTQGAQRRLGAILHDVAEEDRAQAAPIVEALQAALAHFRQSSDPRDLFGLPREERRILESLSDVGPH